MYNAFAAAITDLLLPAFRSIGVNLRIEMNESGLFRVVQLKSKEYYKRTGLSPFPG
jgi:hypothetical protein